MLSSVINYDIIILTETWLRDDVADTELVLDNYSVYRRDRDDNSKSNRGGGVLIVVKDMIC